ncbi:hypothetical protein C2S51_033319 [Perilla frutescens var. frutescens]|nr:hypothetical protein C2S51_033319 [Perilla frutescens var. frutescens]
MNDTTDKHAKLNRSLAEIERVRALFELAIENSELDTPHLQWKNKTLEVVVQFSYATFEAFAMKEEALQEPGLPDKRKCLQRATAVFERALCYFRTSASDLKEERAMLLEEWLNMENNFGELGDVESVLANMPKKLNRIRHVETEDGPARYEEYIDYIFLEEARATNLKNLEVTYEWENGMNKAIKAYDRRARSQQQ